IRSASLGHGGMIVMSEHRTTEFDITIGKFACINWLGHGTTPRKRDKSCRLFPAPLRQILRQEPQAPHAARLEFAGHGYGQREWPARRRRYIPGRPDAGKRQWSPARSFPPQRPMYQIRLRDAIRWFRPRSRSPVATPP